MSSGGGTRWADAGSEIRERYIGAEWTPWSRVELPPCDIPGMITTEEKRYYVWVGRYFSGAGEAVELGPWLGCSTCHILTGLLSNGAFRGRQLHVYDDFVWRSAWMDGKYDGQDRPSNGGDFEPLFHAYMRDLSEHVVVEKRKIAPAAENASLPEISWNGAPIELLYVDCGRTWDSNEAWWRLLSPSFIPGRTLIMMQDWQTYKEEPRQPYNQTKEFTESKGNALELIHELRFGDLATFLFK